jgi:hypothetical protein
MDEDDRAGRGGAAEDGRTTRWIEEGLADIGDAIQQLNRTRQQGKITLGELVEERELLEAQRQALTARR